MHSMPFACLRRALVVNCRDMSWCQSGLTDGASHVVPWAAPQQINAGAPQPFRVWG